jgi:hypothetical protein
MIIHRLTNSQTSAALALTKAGIASFDVSKTGNKSRLLSGKGGEKTYDATLETNMNFPYCSSTK